MTAIATKIKLEDVVIDQPRLVEIDEHKIGLYRLEDGLYAVDDLCPHRDAPLHTGFLKNGQIVCPWHQWHFRLSDGICTNIPGAKIKSYKVDVRDGEIWITL